jgi:DNA-binding MarR family transcriptional regulator
MATSRGPSTDQAVRAMLLLMPRLAGRVKRLPVPEALRGLDLAPRHLSLLSNLLLDGPLTVSQLAERLEVATTTVSLMVGDLARHGVLVRREDAADRRRRFVDISEEYGGAIEDWLSRGATAWREALSPLSSVERRTVVETFRAYEDALGRLDTKARPEAAPAVQ